METRTYKELDILQSWPLEKKLELAEAKILEFVHKMGGVDKVYISFSGGKDSTVLLHIARGLFPTIEAVFADTGLEFPEIREFVKSVDNVTWVKPKMNFREVIDKWGYPLVSKEVADAVYYGKRNPNSIRGNKLFKNKGKTFDLSKWSYLAEAPFDLNPNCCQVFKKGPFKEFHLKSGKYPITGTLAQESRLRKTSWIRNGCNTFTKGHEHSQPLSIWTEGDIWEYIKENNVKISSIYQKGYKRTGCMFCGFGAHIEKGPNRFQMMKKTHPNLYEYIMKPKELGGLGMKEPLELAKVDLSEEPVKEEDYDWIEALENKKVD